MGRPYQQEIGRLAATYDWSTRFDSAALVDALHRALGHPAIAVGSGGSLTTAYFVAQLHERYGGSIAKACTPLDILGSPRSLEGTSVVVASSGGRNGDILSAFRAIEPRGPRSTIVACGTAESPLGEASRLASGSTFVAIKPPGGKDGYLATNSLLAFATVFLSAYNRLGGGTDTLPPSLHDVLGAEVGTRFRTMLEASEAVWGRRTIVLLHGPSTAAGAIDLESRLAESGIVSVQVVDYRNFAHGRHLWLDRNAESTAVVAFSSPEDGHLPSRTLALIPSGIPVLPVQMSNQGALAGLESIVMAILLVGVAGKVLGLDPGRPTVPVFGRKIYHLKVDSKNKVREEHGEDSAATLAIARKWRGERRLWANRRELLDAFLARVRGARFTGIVLDYDGTICEPADRFRGVSNDVAVELIRLLEAGLPIGVATGRGASAGEALRAVVPKAYWERMLVGYYNGGILAPLANIEAPSQGRVADNEMDCLASILRSDRVVSTLADIESRRFQVTAKLRQSAPERGTWQAVAEVVRRSGKSTLDVVRSSHSIDVLAPGITKLSTLLRLREAFGLQAESQLLCIGDRGKWPGNDSDLLSSPFSLSVDEVSANPETCWDLAPDGVRGIRATRYYLQKLTVTDGLGQLAV